MKISENIKNIIYRALKKYSKSSFRPTRDFNQFFEHIKKIGFYPGTVIDVGAAKGTPPLQSAFKDAYFIWFEPLKEFVESLRVLTKDYAGEVHQCALMATSKKGSIFRTKDLFGSSVMHTINNREDNRIEEIEIKTLDGVLAGRDLARPYLLKVDCQGGDYQVVLGGKEILKLCEIVILEVSFFKFWGSQHPEPLQILNYMDKQGFAIYDILDGLFRPLDNALGQVDFVFVKKDGMFRLNHAWNN